MVAGCNARASIWRMTNEPDDVVGGAVLTGTVQFAGVLTRLDEKPASQLLLQQGLETIETYSATIVPGTLDIRRRDEYEITEPLDHQHYGHRFRILNVQRHIFNPRNPNNYMLLSMR